jgi:hypothetical protein
MRRMSSDGSEGSVGAPNAVDSVMLHPLNIFCVELAEEDAIMGQIVESLENGSWLFQCPHCACTILVPANEINCTIFRCGSYRKNGEQIHPHMKEPQCTALANAKLIWGCGKPFKMNPVHGSKERYEVVVCGYI